MSPPAVQAFSPARSAHKPEGTTVHHLDDQPAEDRGNTHPIVTRTPRGRPRPVTQPAMHGRHRDHSRGVRATRESL